MKTLYYDVSVEESSSSPIVCFSKIVPYLPRQVCLCVCACVCTCVRACVRACVRVYALVRSHEGMCVSVEGECNRATVDG